VTQYRYAELYSLIKELMLIHQNNGEPEKCQKKTFLDSQKNQYFHPKSVTLRPIDPRLVFAIKAY
jgi:hypothetical protein